MHVCFPASAPGYKYPARSVPLWGLGVSMGLGVGGREGSGTLTGGHGDRTSCVFPRGDVGAGHGGRRSGKLDPASGCARGVAVPRGGLGQGGQAGERQRKPPKGPGGSGTGAMLSERQRRAAPGQPARLAQPPPRVPSAAHRQDEQSGRGASAEETPLWEHPAPDLSVQHPAPTTQSPRRRTGRRG